MHQMYTNALATYSSWMACLFKKKKENPLKFASSLLQIIYAKTSSYTHFLSFMTCEST